MSWELVCEINPRVPSLAQLWPRMLKLTHLVLFLAGSLTLKISLSNLLWYSKNKLLTFDPQCFKSLLTHFEVCKWKTHGGVLSNMTCIKVPDSCWIRYRSEEFSGNWSQIYGHSVMQRFRPRWLTSCVFGAMKFYGFLVGLGKFYKCARLYASMMS